MALSNLRCTGRQELSWSQNVLAPLNAMRRFRVFRVKKYGLDAFSEVRPLFQIDGSWLTFCHRAPVNWDRWAAPDKRLFYQKTKQFDWVKLNAQCVRQTFFHAFS